MDTNPMVTNSYPPLRMAWFVWGLGALLYFVGFFQRVVPAVLTEELMQEFSISASALGNLSSFYFVSYIAMQIPTGIMADTWGPRRLLTAGSFVAAVGTIIFAVAPDFVWASVGRFLIGGSVAVAFVGLLKLSNSWFPSRYYAMVGGMALLSGIIGAVFAGAPLRLLVNHYSWRPIIFASALFTILICGAIWIFVRDNPNEKGFQNRTAPVGRAFANGSRGILSGIIKVLRYPNTWLLYLIPGGVVGCVLTFSGLWGVPYLSTHRNMSTEQAAVLTSALLVAWAIGGPFFGWMSDRLGKRKPLYLAGCGVGVAGWFAIIFLPGISGFFLVVVLLLTGFSSGCMVIGFSFAKESAPEYLAGTASGINNMGVMMGPTILQPVVGWVLDRNWQGKMADNVRIYSLEAYQSGFLLMIIWLSLSFILVFFTKETDCRQTIR